MEKRILTLDGYVYQIFYADGIPYIIARGITKLERIGADETRICFSEPDKNNPLLSAAESSIRYEYRGEKWVEQERGERFSHICQFEKTMYWLSIEEAQGELKRRCDTEIEKARTGIKKLEELIVKLNEQIPQPEN